MATNIYNIEQVELIDGTVIEITPLKIIYLREFMDKFLSLTGDSTSLIECALVAMKQYFPSIKTVEELEDSIDLPSMYKIVNVAAGISISKIDDDKNDKPSDGGQSWEKLDLAKLEAEVFLLGIWKDYNELEKSLSMPELTATLEIKRETEYSDKKFMAAMQGVDLDKQSGNQDAWEQMKARVFSGGATNDANDVLSLQGVNAQKAGFGIGMGLDYEKID